MISKSMLPILFIASFSITETSQANVAITLDGKMKVERFINTLMPCHGTVGLSMAVVAGSTDFTRAYGLADRETGRSVTTDTLFGLGSITKFFTSALLSAVLDNTPRFSWNTPVAEILGNDFHLSDEDLTRIVTLKDILTHRSGLLSTNIPQLAAFQEDMTIRDLFERLRYLPVENSFRDVFSDNNVMYSVLAYIIERIGDDTWENLMEQLIFAPLGMSDTKIFGTSFNVTDENVAKPYIKTESNGQPRLADSTIYNIGPYKASGAVASSANDMVKLIQMFLRNGQTPEGVQVLSSAHVKEMTAVHVSTPPNPRTTLSKSFFPISSFSYGYGYGWSIGMHRGYNMLWQSGFLYGYDTILMLFPQLDVGIYIGVNGVGSEHSANVVREVLYFVVDILLGEEPWLNTSNACYFPTQWQNYDMPPSHLVNSVPNIINDTFFDSNKFTGTYGHKLFGNVEVSSDMENHLHVRFGRIEGRLHTTPDNNVAILEVTGMLVFTMFFWDNHMTYFHITFKAIYNNTYSVFLMSAPQWGETSPLEFNRSVNYYDDMEKK